jgi:hypothetical protein
LILASRVAESIIVVVVEGLIITVADSTSGDGSAGLPSLDVTFNSDSGGSHCFGDCPGGRGGNYEAANPDNLWDDGACGYFT